jgi:hypothetical protein
MKGRKIVTGRKVGSSRQIRLDDNDAKLLE